MTATEKWRNRLNGLQGMDGRNTDVSIDRLRECAVDLAAAENSLEAMYDKITDWFEVEDWTDPCKGLTEVEAHFNALDKGMEEWSAMTDRIAAAEERAEKAEHERDKWKSRYDAKTAGTWIDRCEQAEAARDRLQADSTKAIEVVAYLISERDRLREEVEDLMLFYIAMLPRFQPTYYSQEMLSLTTRIETRRQQHG